MSVEQIEAILGHDGIIVKTFGKNSPAQLAYALKVHEGFNAQTDVERKQRTRINMLEAETGTGKTLGYLVPLMLQIAATGKRGAVSTFTRNLQHQMTDDGRNGGKVGDVILAKNWVAEITGVHVSVAVRMGMANFGSASAVQNTISMLRNDDDILETERREAIELLEKLYDFLIAMDDDGKPSNSGLIDDFLDDQNIEAFPPCVSQSMICLRGTSPEADSYAYRLHVEESKKADLLICNHATLILHAKQWGRILDSAEKQLAYVVIDEADRLPGAAESIATTALPLHGITDLFKRIAFENGMPEMGQAIGRLYDEIYNYGKRCSKSACPATELGSLSTMIDKVSEHVKKALATIKPALSIGDGGDMFITPQSRLLMDFANSANEFLRFGDLMRTSSGEETAVVSFSPVRNYPSLAIGQANPARLLKRLFQGNDDPNYPTRDGLEGVLFTSATLASSGWALPRAFDSFSSEIGVVRHAIQGSNDPVHNVILSAYSQFAPSEFGSLDFVLADPAAPLPALRITDDHAITSATWLEYCAGMIRFAHSKGGKVLVLTISHKDSIALDALLHDLNPIVARKNQPIGRLVTQYKQTENAILISASAWEGIDLPNQIQHLVITRIPFSPPSHSSHVDLIYKAHLQNKGLSEDRIDATLKARGMQRTWRKLRQGLGRPIRSSTDKATVWIADPRFPRPESLDGSLDALLMQNTEARKYPAFADCIPARFRKGSWQRARFFTLDKQLYEIEEL